MSLALVLSLDILDQYTGDATVVVRAMSVTRTTWQYCQFLAFDIREAWECLQACIQWQIDEAYWDQEARGAVRQWEHEQGYGTDDEYGSE